MTVGAHHLVVLLVLLALPFIFLLEHLPSSILGATVIGAVIRLIKLKNFLKLLRSNFGDALVGVGTLVATLATSPRIERGILIGLIFSFINYLIKKKSQQK